MSEPGDSDADLIARTAAGDRAALGALVARHQAAVLRFARGLVGDAHAEDVLQETFLAALRGAGTFRGESAVRTWLFTIARNAAFRHRRGSAATQDVASIEELGVEAGWGSSQAPSLDARIDVGAALARLDPADRETLLLRDVEGLSGDEVAAVLGLTLAAQKSRLHRARLRFVAALGAGGGT